MQTQSSLNQTGAQLGHRENTKNMNQCKQVANMNKLFPK